MAELECSAVVTEWFDCGIRFFIIASGMSERSFCIFRRIHVRLTWASQVAYECFFFPPLVTKTDTWTLSEFFVFPSPILTMLDKRTLRSQNYKILQLRQQQKLYLLCDALPPAQFDFTLADPAFCNLYEMLKLPSKSLIYFCALLSHQ